MYSEFDDAVEAFRKAQQAFVQGDPRPTLECYSRRDDVTLANPLGPPQVGPAAVAEAACAAAALLRDGSILGYEEVARYATDNLGYVVQLEQSEARLPGSETMHSIALRATLVFRREDVGWKIVHRHADPITTPRPITTAIES